MQLRNTETRYGAVAKTFHWGMAFLIIFMLCLGFWMTDLSLGMQKLAAYGWHKSIGAGILGLAALRLVWRLITPPPLLPEHMKWYERLGADSSHWLLYGCMFAMPLSGWMMSSAAGFPVSVFGWFTLPNFVPANNELRETLAEAHEIIAFILIGLISVHVFAALFHHIVYNDRVLKRMLPWGN